MYPESHSERAFDNPYAADGSKLTFVSLVESSPTATGGLAIQHTLQTEILAEIDSVLKSIVSKCPPTTPSDGPTLYTGPSGLAYVFAKVASFLSSPSSSSS